MSGLKIFISHSQEERRLAKAWQMLINTLTSGAIVPWHSSDERAEGGMETGEWRKQLESEVEGADIILVLVTPISNEKPWLFWEAGSAKGQGKEIIPVFYYMKRNMVHSVFREFSTFQGDDVNEVLKLCGKLLYKHLGKNPPESSKTPWKGWIDQYMEEVLEEKEKSFERTLFQDHFHDSDAATHLEGSWFAKWTQEHPDGSEEVFEVDNLNVWTSEKRIRMVGFSTKEGRDKLTIKDQELAKHYPMEGVVSRAGWVALSYWSAGKIPICGTTLLQPVGTAGNILEGTWEGFTAKHFKDNATHTRGRVVMSQNREVVEEYWPEVKSKKKK